MAPRKPSPQWPKCFLIPIRILQLISAIVIIGITAFFTYHLVKEDIGIPYELIALDVIASITTLNILLTFLLLCFRSLSPALVLIIDAFLALLWGLAFIFLARAMGDTTVEKCSSENFGDYTIVCHLYKILLAFSVLGWIFHLLSCWLALSVRRRRSRHAHKPGGNGGGIGLVGLGGSTGYKPLDGGGAGPGMMPPPAYKAEGGASAYGSGGAGLNSSYYGA